MRISCRKKGSAQQRNAYYQSGTLPRMPALFPRMCKSRTCFDEKTHKMTIDTEHCAGCGRCLGACNFDAISFEDYAAVKTLNCRMAEYTKAVLDGRPNFHISLVVDVSPNCDCHGEMIHRFCPIWECLPPLIHLHSIRRA